jgi:hypothetical protein
METIKNYLEAMFAGMPNTAEVRKAKAELLQMMEDKYNELIAEGQSENTAVGTVISEFGNLDELAEDLGLTKEVEETRKTESELPRRPITTDDAKEYLANRGRKVLYRALGIMLLIIAVAGPILLASRNGRTGAAVMFTSIAIGVGLIIYSSFIDHEWKFLKSELCRMDMATAEYVKERRRSFESVRALCVTIGIILCIICWLPNVLFFGVAENYGPALMFLFVGFGVFLIVYASSYYSGFETLLQLNDINTISGSYVRPNDRSVRYKSKTAETIAKIYWPCTTCIYLIISFLTFSWGLTWIIWPIAGVLHRVVMINCVDDEY